MTNRRYFLNLGFGAALGALAGKSQEPKDLKLRIRKPIPAEYRVIREAENWHNPFLLIAPDGVCLQRYGTRKPGVSVRAVPGLLQALPNSAWPLGLVVAVQEIGIRGEDEQDALISNRRMELMSVLKRLGIMVEFWPSA